jgi:hypothetical protein
MIDPPRPSAIRRRGIAWSYENHRPQINIATRVEVGGGNFD